MLDTPLQLVCTAAHKSHGDLCFQLNFIVLWWWSLSSSSSSSSVLTAALWQPSEVLGFTAQRLFVSQGSCSAARGRHGGCFCTGLQHWHTNTARALWLYRTGHDDSVCIALVTVSVPVYNTDTRTWLYRTGRSTTLTQEYDYRTGLSTTLTQEYDLQNRPLYSTDTHTNYRYKPETSHWLYTSLNDTV